MSAHKIEILVKVTYSVTQKEADSLYDVDTTQEGWAQRVADVDAQAFESIAEASEFLCTTPGLALDVVSAGVALGEQ